MAALRNYFDYFPVAPKLKAWGLYATGFGAVHVPPGAPYPPPGHPGRHAFDWERGRVLGEYQIVYLHKGRGAFESARTKRRPLRAGMAFLLFPGVWHRYRPDPRTGWDRVVDRGEGTVPRPAAARGRARPAQPGARAARRRGDRAAHRGSRGAGAAETAGFRGASRPGGGGNPRAAALPPLARARRAPAHGPGDFRMPGAVRGEPGGPAPAGGDRAAVRRRLLLFPPPVQGADRSLAEAVPDRRAASPRAPSAAQLRADREGDFRAARL
ncbi:MAG: AraC family ligand binding domain-containing protein [Verrucomicrobiota bacterium]